MSLNMAVLEDNVNVNDDGGNSATTVSNGKVASVYSSAEIARHQNRMLRLRLLEENEADQDDDESSIDDDNETLDVNIRIFEDTGSVCNNVTGEILCKLKNYIDVPLDDDRVCSAIVNNKEGIVSTTTTTNNNNHGNNNFNSSLSKFKVVFKANFEKSDKENENDNQQPIVDDLSSTIVVNNRNDDCNDSSNEKTNVDQDDEPYDRTLNDEDIRSVAARIFNASNVDMEIFKNKPIRKSMNHSTMYQLKKKYRQRMAENSSDEQRTMFDFIFYNPPSDVNNVKTESINLDGCEQSIENGFTPKQEEQLNDGDDANNDDEEMVDDVDAVDVPRLTVDADGNIVIDKKSLLVESTSTVKSRRLIANNGIVLEHGRVQQPRVKKRSYQKPWTAHETFRFYLLVSTFTTDFTQIANHFADRSRNCVKRKFAKEEKLRPTLLYKALRCSSFDPESLKRELGIFDQLLNQQQTKTPESSIDKKPIIRKRARRGQ